jgi:hypothetical protein
MQIKQLHIAPPYDHSFSESSESISVGMSTPQHDEDDFEDFDWAKPTLPPSTSKQFLDKDIDKRFNKLRYFARNMKNQPDQLDRLLSGYKYTALGKDEIRLLVLHKGKKEDEIVCTIRKRKLQDVKQRFFALSYHWGDDEPAYEITLYDEGSTAKKWMDIRYHLSNALRALRQEDRDVPLWVDAICINQEKDSDDAERERENQVSIMARIYNSASNTCVWLGNGDQRTDRAMDFIRKLMDLSVSDSFIDSKHRENWKALADLMTVTWFSRRWVVQEISLARKASIHCGEKVRRTEILIQMICSLISRVFSGMSLETPLRSSLKR